MGDVARRGLWHLEQVLLLLLLSCDSAGVADPAPEVIDPVAHLARVSLDLRGIRASPEELLDVLQSPGKVQEYAEQWVAEPAFAEQMAWHYNERLHTAVAMRSTPRRYVLSEPQHRAMGWAPLEHVRQIIAEDRNFTEVVTAQSIPVSVVQAQTLGWSEPAQDWDVAPVPDGRPMAGILSSPTLWLVIDGDATSMNRQRANAVARIFLCTDFLDREGDFEFALAPEDLQSSEQATQTQDACRSCHAALDPLAAALGGFSERSVAEPIEQAAVYSTFTQDWFRSWVEPAYYGAPLGDLADLGEQVAADPRYGLCTTRYVAESLLGRGLRESDPLLEWGPTASVQAGALALVQTPEYRSTELRTLSNSQLYSMAVDLGERLGGGELSERFEPLLWSPDRRVLAGGGDDFEVLEENKTPSLGHHLSMAWVARELAVAVSLAGPRNETEVRIEIVRLHTLILSQQVLPASPEVDALWQLFQAAGAWDTPEVAWDVVLQALVRHPKALVY
ncbi:MAG: hypothetical protein ACI9VR_003047 [Cognaticolwellia sp.]